MRFSAAVALLLVTTPAYAGATDWQELAPGARARLISADVASPDGAIRIGLEIDMPPELKTYWRVPGETGIPTTFDFSRSTGVGDYRVIWPYPTIESTEAYDDFVYRGPTVLPVELAGTGGPVTIGLDVVMGICSDICVPVQASFSLPISLATPDPGQGLRIEQAIAQAPIAPAEDTAIGTATLHEDGLAVALAGADADPASVIAAATDPAILFGAPQKSPDNAIVILPLLGGVEQSLVGQRIEITYMTSAGPFVVEREIFAAGSTSAAR